MNLCDVRNSAEPKEKKNIPLGIIIIKFVLGSSL